MHIADLLKEKYYEHLNDPDAVVPNIEDFVDFVHTYLAKNPPIAVSYPQNGLGFILREGQQVTFEEQLQKTIADNSVPITTDDRLNHTGMLRSEAYNIYGHGR